MLLHDENNCERKRGGGWPVQKNMGRDLEGGLLEDFGNLYGDPSQRTRSRGPNNTNPPPPSTAKVCVVFLIDHVRTAILSLHTCMKREGS